MMTLDKMDEHLKEQQNTKRRLELEAKLYGYWYPEMSNGNLIFEAKSDNEVLAQLNMLEKRLKQQGEKNETQAKMHDLKMLQEKHKLDHIQLDRQQIREQEIHEIRTMQETHMNQLKQSQHEYDTLMEKEKKLKLNLDELNKEFELLQKCYEHKNSIHFTDADDIENIKVLINQRSQEFRSEIKMCMSILERTLEFAEHPEDIRNLIVLLEAELETDANAPSKIEAMNSAEAKSCLQQIEQAWQVNHEKCCAQIKDILSHERDSKQSALGETMQRLEKLHEMRNTHLDAVDNSGVKVKKLIQEEDNAPHPYKTESQGEEEHKKTVTFTRRHPHQQGEESRDFPLHSSCNNRETVMILSHGKLLEEHKNPHPHQQGEESKESSLKLSSNRHEAKKNESHLEERRHSKQQGGESNDSSLNSSAKKQKAHMEERHHSHHQGEESNDSSLNESTKKHETHLEERRHSQQQGGESNDSSLNSSAKKQEVHFDERHHSHHQGEESNDSSLNASAKKQEAHLEERHHSHHQGKESNDSSLNASAKKQEVHSDERHHSHHQGEESNDSSLNASAKKQEVHSEERHHSHHQGEESNESSLNSSAKKQEAHLKDRRHSNQQGEESNESSLKLLSNEHEDIMNESKYEATNKIVHHVSEESVREVHKKENFQLLSSHGDEHKQTFASSRRHPHQQGEESAGFPLYSSCNSHEAINEAHAEGRRHSQQQGGESNDSSLNSSAKKQVVHSEERHHSHHQGEESNDSSLNSLAKKQVVHSEERHHSHHQGEESNDSSLNSSAKKQVVHSEERHHSHHQGEESNDSSLNSSAKKQEIHSDGRRHSQQQGGESNDSSLNSSAKKQVVHSEERHHSHHQGEESNDSSLNSSAKKQVVHSEERHHSHHQGEESNDSSLYSSSNKHGSNKNHTHLEGRRHSHHQGEESIDSSVKLSPNEHETKDGEEHKQQNIRSAPLHPQQVVTAETEANRPRFGRRHSATNEETIYSHPNSNESHNNLSPRCFDSHGCDDIDQASNSFNNLNIDDWQNNPHPTKNELDDMRMNNQRELRVVTAETEADRPRFGINHHECLNSQLTATEREELRKLVSLSMRHTHQITEESVDSPFYNPGFDDRDQDELDEFKHQVGLVVSPTY